MIRIIAGIVAILIVGAVAAALAATFRSWTRS